jgi:hypothetical protein
MACELQALSLTVSRTGGLRMARRRRNDPPGLGDDPVCVRDPARRAEGIAEFRRRLAYLEQHYRMGKRFHESITQFNDAIRALNALAAGEPAGSGEYRRLSPMIEIAVSANARRFAQERTGRLGAPVEGQDIKRAAEHVGERVRPISNRPRADNLKHHVKGLMALIQDFSGRPVVPRRNRNSVYDPHFMPGVSCIVPMIFEHLEPSVTIVQLVNIAEKARREWAGRRPRFKEYFPAYGLRPGADGSLLSPSGLVIATFEPNIPTYFH